MSGEKKYRCEASVFRPKGNGITGFGVLLDGGTCVHHITTISIFACTCRRFDGMLFDVGELEIAVHADMICN
ncbi:hypothetical protein GOP47_0021785 [Adiantum capillus-veneris]|uniref:Uncharacterized protein n=1 Tax=Adiantum capillus-veneris TaxID=13818 RepID=A0A9D4U857_ADICA|nr:hypothetical protein GOP47_0021785 [Adiantum capillus-veneris]